MRISISYIFQVILTDETTVQVDCNKVQVVRRGPNDPILPAHLQQQLGYPIKIMFWGCISVLGPGCLVPVIGTLRSAEYIDILQTHLLPIANAWYGDDVWYLQQDNASCHTSVQTRAALRNMHIHDLP